MQEQDTIVALATPPGEGGIGIIRISGGLSLDIIRQIFVSPNGQHLRDFRDRYLYYGYIEKENGETIDEVMVVSMRKPRSYTREDIVEVHCHGGMMPIGNILE